MDKERNPQNVRQYSLGILLFFYSGKAPTRLVVALIVMIVKPFDDVVAGYTTHDSNEKREHNFHMNTSSRCRVLVGQQRDYITYFHFILQISKIERFLLKKIAVKRSK